MLKSGCEARRLYQRKYYATHREQWRAYQRRWYAEHLEIQRARRRGVKAREAGRADWHQMLPPGPGNPFGLFVS